jgi:hypothetical protein
MNLVSSCCAAPLITRTRNENPLGDKEYNGLGLNYKYTACESCGEECEELEQCEICGLIGCKEDCYP